MNTALKLQEAQTDVIALSPSSIRTLKSCKARWVYENCILPKIETERTKKITRFGTLFHQNAEHDFRKNIIENLHSEEKHSVKRELEEYGERIQGRDYFPLPSVNEQYLIIRLDEESYFRGIPDRICYDNDRVIIVDYKTAAIPDPQKDRLQALAYALLLYRLEGILPERITLIIDYVKADEVYRFSTTRKEIEDYEGYVKQAFIEARVLKEAYNLHGEIRKVPHTVGDCSFCPMAGSCLAYHSVKNPVPDTLDTETLSTDALAKELSECESIKKLYDERTRALKEALMLRDEEGDTMVRDYCTIVESRMTAYPSAEVLTRLLDDAVRRAVRNDRYRFLIDTTALTGEISRSLITLLPDNIPPQNIPGEYLDSLEEVKLTIPRAKYLKVKKRKED